MSLIDKAKSAAGQAATKAKEGVEDVQTKRELSQAFTELGKATYTLIGSGEVTHSSLEPLATRIRELSADQDTTLGTAATEASTVSASDRPTETD